MKNTAILSEEDLGLVSGGGKSGKGKLPSFYQNYFKELNRDINIIMRNDPFKGSVKSPAPIDLNDAAKRIKKN